MAFEAGEIKGSLNLDTTSFKKGFDEAHTHAQTKAAHIREVLESLTEVFYEALGPAVAEFSQQIQSVFAGFSEGPIIGSLGAIATAFGFAREAVGDVAGEFHRLGLEAQKAGVSVEFMDGFANVASTAGLSIEQVGMAFKILEQRGEEALGPGGEKVAAAFQKLRISTADLPALLEQPQKLMERLQDGMQGLATAAERNAVAQQIGGRQGASMIPVLTMTREEFDKTKETMDRLSGGINQNSVQIGTDVEKLEAYFSKAFQGIQRAVAIPIMAYLSDHMVQIEAVLEAITTRMIAVIGGTVGFIVAHISTIIHAIEGAAAAVGLLAAVSLPAILSAIATAATAAAGPLIAMAVAVATPVAGAIALGAAAGVLIGHFPILGQYAGALGTILKALAIVVGKELVIAFEWLKGVISETHAGTDILIEAFDRLANGPLAPAVHAITDSLQQASKAFHWIQDEVSKLIDKLMELAGMDGGTINIPGAKNVEDARRELGMPAKEEKPDAHSEPSPAGDGPTKVTPREAASGATPKAHVESVPSPAGDGPSVAMPSRTAVAASADHAGTHAQTSIHTDAVAKLGDAVKSAEQKHVVAYSTIRAELTDAVKGADGLYHLKSSSGGGIGGAFTEDQYRNLRESEKANRTSSINPNSRVATATQRSNVGAGPAGEDSVTQWRRSHPQQPDSISQRAGGGGNDALKGTFAQIAQSLSSVVDHLKTNGNGGQLSPASSTVKPANVTYNVNVSAQIDPKQTASALAGQLLPVFTKLQRDHDQKAAGEMAAMMVSNSLGGGSG